MAGIADVVVVFRCAGHGKGVVAAHGVLHHLDQRHPVLIEVFRMQARHRIGVAHQGAAGRYVQRVLDALVELPRVEALEVGALPTIHVEDLDIVTSLDEIAFRRRRFDPQVQDRVGQRIGQVILPHQSRLRPLKQKRDRRCRVLRFGGHRHAGRGDHQPALVQRRQLGPRPRRSLWREKPQRARLGQVDPAALQPLAQADKACLALGQHRLQPLGPRVRGLPQDHGVDPPVLRRRNQFDRLPALVIHKRQPVAHRQLHKHRAAARHHMPLLAVMA